MALSDVIEDRFIESLKELMTGKSFQKITVEDICRKASLSRGTFYHYFRDKYDLSFQPYRRQAELELQQLRLTGDWELLTCNLYHHFLQNREYYTKLLKDMSQNSFVPSLIAHSRPYFIKAIEEYTDLSLDDELLFALKFNNYAAVYTVIEWIQSGMKESPEEMSHLVVANTPWAKDFIPRK